ncbi:MAG: DNA-binding response regulator [Blastocatellia bacterium]|nr:MAG: DNA-binding response regulator [Blastocatellia bacterium]
MSQNNDQIHVTLIEDERDVREGLTVLINGSPGFRCVGAFRTMEDALQSIGDRLPDVVLTDIGLPGMSGIDGTRVLKERYPNLPVVALTVYDDAEDVFAALCAGASGYLLKNTTPVRLLESLKEVASGGAPMSPTVAHRVIKLFREFRPPETATHDLTGQETELLKLIVDGHTYKTAAVKLDITVRTVSFHLHNVYQKLQVHSKSEAVAKALREHLV